MGGLPFWCLLCLILFARIRVELVIGFLLYPTVFLVHAKTQLMNEFTHSFNRSFTYSGDKCLFVSGMVPDPEKIVFTLHRSRRQLSEILLPKGGKMTEEFKPIL